MNRKGFTLIEVIVSIVLVSVVMVSLLGSLIQLRQTYTVIHEDSDIIVYSSSISRVINNDLSLNNGIRYCTCEADGKTCDIILGNDQRRELKILKACYIDGEEVDCNGVYNNEKQIVRTTLKYTDNTRESDPKLVYIRTLEMSKYEKNGVVSAKGYNFADMSTTVYEHDNEVQNVEDSIIDQYTTILIRLNNEVNEDLSKHDIILYTAGRYNYSNLMGKRYTLYLNDNGAQVSGTTRIDEIFGVGYFETEDNHLVKQQISSRNPIELPQNGELAFMGYYYKPGGNSEQEIQVIDSSGAIVTSSRFFRENIDPNLSNDPTIATIIAKWGTCTAGYKIVNGRCVPVEYTVTLDAQAYGGDPSYKVNYMSLVPNTAVPYRAGYRFDGYYSSGVLYNNDEGIGKFVYNIDRNSTANAQFSQCSNAAHATGWRKNNNCEITSCATGYTLRTDASGKTYCDGNIYKATFKPNGASVSVTELECKVSNDAGNCSITGPTITRDGFEPKNWNENANATDGLSVLTMDGNKTFYAITYKKVTVTFNANGNTTAASSKTCDIWNTATKCSVTSPTLTPASGFTTIGWSTAAGTHENQWTPETSKDFTADTPYYAQSSKAGFNRTITFYKNNNTSFTYNGTTYTDDSKAFNACTISAVYNGAAQSSSCTGSITMPTITPPTNYQAKGWATSSTGSVSYNAGSSQSITFDGNKSYYAISEMNNPAVITCTNKKYNGSNQTIAKCSGGTVQNATQKNVGEYDITCNPDSTHTTATSKKCKIEKGDSNLSCSSLDFNGAEQTACTCTTGSLGGTYKAKNAGTYTATCTGGTNYNSGSKKWTMKTIKLYLCDLDGNFIHYHKTDDNHPNYCITNKKNKHPLLTISGAEGNWYVVNLTNDDCADNPEVNNYTGKLFIHKKCLGNLNYATKPDSTSISPNCRSACPG